MMRGGSRPYQLAEPRERDSELPCAGALCPPRTLARTQEAPASTLHGPARHSGEDLLWHKGHSGGPLRTFSPSRLTWRGHAVGDQIGWRPLGAPRKRRVIAAAGLAVRCFDLHRRYGLQIDHLARIPLLLGPTGQCLVEARGLKASTSLSWQASKTRRTRPKRPTTTVVQSDPSQKSRMQSEADSSSAY